MDSIEKASVKVLIDEITASNLRPNRRSQLLRSVRKLLNPRFTDEDADKQVKILRRSFEMEVTVVSNPPKELTTRGDDSSRGSRDVTETATKNGNETPTIPTKGRKRMSTKTPAAKFNEKLSKLKDRANNQELQTKAGGPAIAELIGLMPRAISDESSTDAVAQHIQDKLTAFEEKLKELEVAHGIRQVRRDYKKELETEVTAHGQTKNTLNTMERDRSYARNQISRVEGKLDMQGVDENAQVGKRIENVFNALSESGNAVTVSDDVTAQLEAFESSLSMNDVDPDASLADRIKNVYTTAHDRHQKAAGVAREGTTGLERIEQLLRLNKGQLNVPDRTAKIVESVTNLQSEVDGHADAIEAAEKAARHDMTEEELAAALEQAGQYDEKETQRAAMEIERDDAIEERNTARTERDAAQARTRRNNRIAYGVVGALVIAVCVTSWTTYTNYNVAEKAKALLRGGQSTSASADAPSTGRRVFVP